MTSPRLEAAEMRFLRSVTGYTRLDKIRSEVNNNNNNAYFIVHVCFVAVLRCNYYMKIDGMESFKKSVMKFK